MKIVTSLLVGASALALLPSAAAAAPASSTAEVRALRQQVEELVSRLQVLEAQQRESVAGVANAQAQASAAAAQATAAASQAQTAQAQAVQVAAANAKPAKAAAPKWYDSTSISGRMYFNVSHISQKSDGNTVAHSTAFDIKRFYLGIDHKFNDTFSANLTTDVSLIANSNTVNGTTGSPTTVTGNPATGSVQTAGFAKNVGETLYIKKAYLQAKLSNALTFRVGAADMPWVPFVEDLYGYRFVENTLIDRTAFGTSADWGVHAFGSLAEGHVTYAVSVVDGATYRNPLRSKSIDVEGRVAVNYKGVTAAVGAYRGKRAFNTDTPYSPGNAALTPVQTDPTPAAGTGQGTAVGDVNPYHTATRYDAVLAYVGPKLRVGGEYFYSKNWNRVTQPLGDSSEGYGGWASFNFYKTFSVFGKYEHVKPTKKRFPAVRENYFNAGLNWEPTKIVDLAVVYKHDKVDNGYFSPTNANPSNFAFPIGGRDHGSYSEIGIWGQLRF